MGSKSTSQQARVLEFWRALEIFNPPQVPGPQPRANVWTINGQLPWEYGHQIQLQRPREKYTWQHTVYLGLFNTKALTDHLDALFGDDEESYDRGSWGESALGALSVGQDGALIDDSLVVSSGAWAVGRSIKPGVESPNWLDGFTKTVRAIAKKIPKKIGGLLSDDTAEGPAGLAGDLPWSIPSVPLSLQDLTAIVTYLAQELGVEDVLKPTGIRIASRQVPIKSEDSSESGGMDFLNSFLIEDLDRVRSALKREGVGTALDSYLTDPAGRDTLERFDVRADPDLVADRLTPDEIPSGRWPDPATRPLGRSQQFAVSTAYSELRDDSGVFGINGPPGTGKTTMLRDLVSAIVVERAQKLAALDSPDDAFETTTLKGKSGDYARSVRELIPELTGHEIVVASSNNGAVENITREIPRLAEIAPEWRGYAEYFSDLSSQVLGEPAWGLAAARLGNMRNRSDFVQSFWWGHPRDRAARPVPGFFAHLKGVDPGVAQENWTAAVERFQAAEAEVERLREERLAAAKAISQIQRSSSARRIKTLRNKLDTAAQKWGAHLPFESGSDERELELAAPWLDGEWNQARSKLTLEAFNLHKAFIEANAETMRKNLHVAMDVLSGSALPEMSTEAVAAAWHTFFLVVPVVSTTFASYGRLFKSLDQEQLGWLFIDEAGQATPQAAVGALWRSQRAVVVGDPRQLEPVTGLSAAAEQRLGSFFEVSEYWLPSRTSVQSIADDLTPFGTHLPGDSEPEWIGAPLRVHRRCDQPMFAVSNTIAYDNFMVHATEQRPELRAPTSAWLDVCGENEDHWIPAQGAAVAALVEELLSAGLSSDSIFVLNPFVQVVPRLRAVVNRVSRTVHVGTIHTAQGKQADAVILLLPGDPRKPGAKRWAAQRPNLLNVAVTRAKRRLYVVGDRAEWSTLPYFSELSRSLPVRTPEPAYAPQSIFQTAGIT